MINWGFGGRGEGVDGWIGGWMDGWMDRKADTYFCELSFTYLSTMVNFLASR